MLQTCSFPLRGLPPSPEEDVGQVHEKLSGVKATQERRGPEDREGKARGTHAQSRQGDWSGEGG